MESKYREVGGKENGQRAAPCEAAPNGAQQSRSSGFVGRGGWIRFSAEKPRWLRCASSVPPRAAFRIHPQIENEQPLTGSLVFWWRRMDSNHRRRSQQIYSLSPLATWVLLRIQLGGRRWSWWTDSNPRPADYKSAALPAELHQHRRHPRSQR